MHGNPVEVFYPFLKVRLLFLKHIQKSFSINNEHFPEILLNDIPFGFPNFRTFSFFNFYIVLSSHLKPAGPTDTFRSLNFISCNHPYLNFSTLKRLYCRFQFVLQFIFNASNSEKFNPTLEFFHYAFDLFFVHLQFVISLLILL